jgi:hypothetical protein
MARLVTAGTVAAIAVGVGLGPAAPSPQGAVAQTFGRPYAIPLHQQGDLPVTAQDFGSHGSCPGVPSDMDGWHFVLPATGEGNPIHRFVELTVDFDRGNEQVRATFAGNNTHAYVSSVPGARLLSAAADVETEEGHIQLDWFNLSHTCPASEPATSPPETPDPETTAPDTTAPETTAPETPTPETPTPETPTPETPAPETPAPETTAPGRPVPECPTASPGQTPGTPAPPGQQTGTPAPPGQQTGTPAPPGQQTAAPAPPGQVTVAPSPAPRNGGPATLYAPALPGSSGDAAAPPPSPVRTCAPVTG